MANKSIDHAITAKSLTTAASDPTHAGILSFMRRKYTKELKGVQAVVWGIPFDAATSNRPGARFGPQAIRRASAIFDNDPHIRSSATCLPTWRRSITAIACSTTANMRGLPRPSSARRQNPEVGRLPADARRRPLRHLSHPEGPCSPARPLALVQFDAHQDTWPDEKGRIDHGAFVGRAAREGLIDVERSIQIGIRTHAPEDCGIRIVYGYELEEMRAEEIADTIIRHVDNRPAYLTFDIDCLDPAFAPGTGTPVAGGPSSAKILSVLRKLGALHIAGSDVVEVAPAYDHADLTAIAGSTIAMYMLGLRAEWLAERRG